MERRSFLMALGAAAPALALPAGSALAAGAPHIDWSVFSKNIQWLTTAAEAAAKPYQTGVLLGSACAEMGFSSINLTVRPSGHVEPANVRTDLPLMLAGIRSTGTRCFEITTAINPPTDGSSTAWIDGQFVESIVHTAAAHGITLYRIGTASYAPNTFGDAMLAQLDGLRTNLHRLVRIGRRSGGDIAAIYHTWDRAGQQDISTPIWDIVHAMRDVDPAVMGLNFNIGHIFQDGPQDLWRINLRYAMSRVRGTGIQDVYWSKNASGQWRAVTPEAGAGAVPWVPFFQTLLQGGFSGPADLQIEYDIKGNRGEVVTLNATYWADSPQFVSGNLSRALLVPSIKTQLDFYKQQATAAGWTPAQQV